MSSKTIPALNRIIIGDVGSGKTIVAFFIALAYLKNLPAGNLALMAPTEVLALQHYHNLLNLINQPNSGLDWVNLVFQTNKTKFINDKSATKKQINDYISDETPKQTIWIGTQALLFQEEILYNLVLIDEQHRFGVRQRQKLSKTKNNSIEANYISFSATPIPRSLALTTYKYLQPHFLERLPGRSKITTEISFFDDLKGKIWQEIQAHLDLKQKVYVICTKIEDKDEEETDGLWSLKKAYETVEKMFPDKVLAIHGKDKEKQKTLTEFRDNPDKQILVSTSVVEVGVDVKQASLMLILNAERFGLAALHQLRGRIGRNSYDNNKCILVTEPDKQWTKRLKYLCQYSDGFMIAQKDLELRGSGELFGSQQSGFDTEVLNLMGLDENLYQEVDKLVESVDFKDLNKKLPRLQNYLDKQLEQAWQE